MKAILLTFLLTFFAQYAQALDIITTDGAIFHDCAALKADGGELRFTHSAGSARVPAFKLPRDLQARHFTPAIVAASQQRAESDALMARAMAVETERQRAIAATATAREQAERAALAENQRAARRRMEDEAAQKAARARQFQADIESGKIWYFEITMVGPTKTGQIARTTSGKTIHVVRDIGLAQGDTYQGFFEPEGMYEYTASGGGAARVKNYIWRGYAGDYIAEKTRKDVESVFGKK